MDTKQRKSLDRHVQRVIARSGVDEDEKLSLFIRVAESNIYQGKPVLKALLKEVIYLRMTDLHEGDLRIPKGTPWSKDYKKYEGWCYARQEYLANRVGCEPTYASKALKQIIKDGYLKTRRYRDKRDGAWHKQYFPDEAFIDAKIEKLLDAEVEAVLASADKSTDKSVPTPTCTNDKKPLALKTSAHLHSVQQPTCTNVQTHLHSVQGRGVSEVCSSGVEGSTLLRQPPASPGIAAGFALPNQEKATPAELGALKAKKALEAEATRKAKPTPQPGYDYCQGCGSTEPGHKCAEDFAEDFDDFPTPKAKATAVPGIRDDDFAPIGSSFDEEEA